MTKKSSQTIQLEKKDFEFPKEFDSLEPNKSLLHLNVVRQLANARAGTASTKTRTEVRGGGAKPWKQKGTGRARAGSIRSPLWVGGGVIFGPKPRDYSFDMPKTQRNLAIAQALVSKKGDIVVLKKLPEIKDAKTKEFIKILNTLEAGEKKVLFVCSSDEKNFSDLKRSSKNVKKSSVKEWEYLGVYDLLNTDLVVFSEDALKNIEDRLVKHLSKKNKNGDK